MKVLIATKETQGRRGNDFSHATEGELVGFTSQCDGEAVDGKCGCRRAMSGLTSHKATTTVKVVDRPDMNLRALTDAIAKSLVSAGWYPTEKDAMEQAAEDARLAEFFKEDAVLEKRGNKMAVRETEAVKNGNK